LRTGGVPIPLGSHAFEIVEALVQSAGDLVTKSELMARIWPGVIVEENTLQVHVSAVRKALGPYRELLKTESGRGYRLLGSWTVWQEGASAVPVDREPTQTPTQAFQTNLPATALGLIGRTVAAQQLQGLLAAHRLVTLTGPGGIGKTVLAQEVGRNLLASIEADAWFVGLVSLSDPDLVPSAVAGILGLQLGGGQIVAESVARAIGAKKLLLVLDNCEHVIGSAAELAETVVHLCPRTTVLATSREILRIDGEYVYRVPPLDVPPRHQNEPGALLEHSAVELFVARTQALDSDFSPRHGDLLSIAAICRRLDGIPLAIEFAAARAATLGLPEVEARLEDRFGLLTGGRRTALPRHQTLHATLDWSYELLPSEERLLLRRLAIFSAGFTLEAAAAVAGDNSRAASAVAEGIANLVTKSLVTRDGSVATGRWRLLETVRAYALEKLMESGETEQIARRHAEFFRGLLAIVSPTLQSPAASENMVRHGQEIDNVRAALAWAFSTAGDTSIGADLTAASVPLWMQLSLLGECRARVEMALGALDRGSGHGLRTEMMLRAALAMSLTYTRGPVQEAESSWERVLELAVGLSDAEYQLRALYGLWLYKILVCEYRAALKWAQQFQSAAERTVVVMNNQTADRMMAMVLHYLGEQEGARVCATRSLSGPAPTNRHIYITRYGVDQRVGALVQLSRALWLQGLPEQAVQAAHASVEEAATVGHANSMCLALADGASIVAIMVGNLASAGRFASMLTEHAEKHNLDVWRIYGCALRGRLLVREGVASDSDGAALLRSALASLRETPFDIRFQLYLVWLAEVLESGRQVVAALAAIDEALRRAEQTEELWYLPELLRIRGELLLQSGAAGYLGRARECFAYSLHLAHSQNTLSWELRSAMSLARFWRNRDRTAEAHELLDSVYRRFTEGFDTADLQTAKDLLNQLS
jgi:predicted ATPase/DNA-binding winged helix-turn-helix (wHTH) protein